MFDSMGVVLRGSPHSLFYFNKYKVRETDNLIMPYIYKFTILYKGCKYCNHQPFYVGQTTLKVSKEEFLSKDRFVYDGSGRIWLKFCRYLTNKFPKCWRKLVKREILFYSEICSQKALDKLEEYYIKKCKAHYSYKQGGCNVLWGTANKFGSGSPMKDPMIAKIVTKKITGRRGAKRSLQGRLNQSIAAKKSWKNADERRIKMSESLRRYMQNGGAKKLSLQRMGHKVSDETKRKISLHHADFSGDKNPNWGKKYKWINNGIIQKKLYNGNKLPTGFIYGVLLKRNEL